MNMKRELIALVIRIIANETTIVRKPTPFEALFTDLIGEESYDQRAARNIEVELDRATETVKRIKTDRKFKKIVRDY
jgi:hypothetical protein